jgi:hypothetical protein
MAEARGRSPIHRIIEVFSGAVSALDLPAPPPLVERWGVSVHQCLSSRAREFHTHQHVLELVEGADPLEALGALYHDTVYVQVDLGVPERFAALLAPFIAREGEAGWRILPHAAQDPTSADVLAVFGHEAGEVLTPFTGLNELASGLVAAREFEGVLTRQQLIALAASIEGTIPFRDGHADGLLARLRRLGVPADEATAMVRRAVRLANRDVHNFAAADPAFFLDNTWKLLPETNPSLHTPSTYCVREYRVALGKMEGFLSRLPPERVFHAWGGEPSPEVHAARLAGARRNIGLGVRYLRCKLYSTALVEALAEETGGDVPLDLFMGGLPEPGGPSLRRIEQHLAPLPQVADVDAALLQLLEGGRATPSSFDMSPSPLARHVYAAQGEAAVMAGVELAQRWWGGQLTARQFLERQPRASVVGLAEAAAHIVDTRADALRALARELA